MIISLFFFVPPPVCVYMCKHVQNMHLLLYFNKNKAIMWAHTKANLEQFSFSLLLSCLVQCKIPGSI